MSGQRRIDEALAKTHFDTVIQDYEQVFENFFLAKSLGLKFEYLNLDAAGAAGQEALKITFDVNEMVMNPQGSLHGGIMAVVMDISMGHLLHKTIGTGATVEMKTQYLRPVFQGSATCEGKFIKKGRTLSFMESKIWGPDNKLAAVASATWKMANG